MIISPFTPLFFSPSTDKYGAKSKYVQLFARADRIFIELIVDSTELEPIVCINNLLNNTSTTVLLSSWKMNDEKIIYFYNITSLPCGYYSVTVNGSTSEIFKVTDDERELSETTLIQYSMKDNKQRLDAIFWIDYMQYFVDFRVPGGFKDNGWAFGVDNEQFITFDEDIVELFSHEYTTQIFTLGNAMGCPVWFAELFNRILCCNYVYFDRVRYARKESNVPELNQQIEGLKSFVFNQMLQKVKVIDPVLECTNQLSLKRVKDDTYRIISGQEELRNIQLGNVSNVCKVDSEYIYVNMSKGDISGVFKSIITDTKVIIQTILENIDKEDTLYNIWTIVDSRIAPQYKGESSKYGRISITGLTAFNKSIGNENFELRLFTEENIQVYNYRINEDGIYSLRPYYSRYGGLHLAMYSKNSKLVNKQDLAVPIVIEMISDLEYYDKPYEPWCDFTFAIDSDYFETTKTIKKITVEKVLKDVIDGRGGELTIFSIKAADIPIDYMDRNNGNALMTIKGLDALSELKYGTSLSIGYFKYSPQGSTFRTIAKPYNDGIIDLDGISMQILKEYDSIVFYLAGTRKIPQGVLKTPLEIEVVWVVE